MVACFTGVGGGVKVGAFDASSADRGVCGTSRAEGDVAFGAGVVEITIAGVTGSAWAFSASLIAWIAGVVLQLGEDTAFLAG